MGKKKKDKSKARKRCCEKPPRKMCKRCPRRLLGADSACAAC